MDARVSHSLLHEPRPDAAEYEALLSVARDEARRLLEETDLLDETKLRKSLARLNQSDRGPRQSQNQQPGEKTSGNERRSILSGKFACAVRSTRRRRAHWLA